MIQIDYETAEQLVKQLYPSARDPMLGIELEITKGGVNYRPYLVAAKFILTEYRRIERADEVTFDYDINKSIRGLLNRQAELDLSDTIPAGQSIDSLLDEICNPCKETELSSGLGIYLI